MNFEHTKNDLRAEDCMPEADGGELEMDQVRLLPEGEADGANFLAVMRELIRSEREQRLYVDEGKIRLARHLVTVGTPRTPSYVMNDFQFASLCSVVEKLAEISPREGTKQLAREMNAEILLDMMNIVVPSEVPENLS